VRYKSATVDEFIENHAHDVSRGGIYIKTGNPFPPGTLLKFEIRLASDQAVIAGVGRVVWKRDSGQSNGEHPAGMGVKFIKIDDPSKSVIDKLVNTRADAGKSFEAEPEGMGASVPPMAPPRAAAVSVSPGKSTMLGMGASTAGETRTSTTPGMGAAPLARKATMMGLGVPGASRPPAVPGVGPRPGGDPATSTPPTPVTTSVSPVPPRPGKLSPPGGTTKGMFPQTDAAKDAAPKQEQTVMKQAAELLEEALREAGGSMEEIGTNPLFAGTGGRSTTPKPMPSVKPEKPPVDDDEEATRVRPASEMAPASAPPPKVASDPPYTSRESPAAKVVVEQDATQPSQRRRVLTASQSAPAPAVPAPPAKKSSSGSLLLTIGFVAAFAAGLWLYRDRLMGLVGNAADQRPQPTPVQIASATEPPASVVTPPPAPPPSASAAASATASATASASAAPAAASASAAASAAASAPGMKAVAAGGTKPPVAAGPRAPKPSPAGGSAEEGASAGASGASGGSTETPSQAAGSRPAAAVASPDGPATTPAAKPKPKPAPKPADDNPY
jgi:uncharacterized protein (TIGR02266 family)